MSEILGAMFKGLLALLGVGAVVAILYQAFGTNKTQAAMTNTTQLHANAQTLYHTVSTFDSLTNEVAINGKLAPSDMISGTELVNPWGGTVTIGVNAGSKSEFDIVHSASIPSDSCAKMTGGLGTAIRITINGTSYDPPVDPGTAATACKAKANAMTFTFGH